MLLLYQNDDDDHKMNKRQRKDDCSRDFVGEREEKSLVVEREKESLVVWLSLCGFQERDTSIRPFEDSIKWS